MTNPFTLTKEQYQELYKEVLLFSQTGGVAADENNLWKMCEEEFVNELLPAVEKGDKLQVIDGVADSFVVFTQLHHCYMSKPSWEQPSPDCGVISAFTYAIGTAEVEECLKTRYTTIIPFIMEFCTKFGEYLAEEYNFNLYKAIKEVNRSNMTKFVPAKNTCIMNYRVTQEALDELASECEELSKGKYKNVRAEIVFHSWTDNDFHGEQLIVFRENFGNGKVVKPLWHFEEPNFEDCWL